MSTSRKSRLMTYELVGHILGITPGAVDRWVKFYNLPSYGELVNWPDVVLLVRHRPELLIGERYFFMYGRRSRKRT